MALWNNFPYTNTHELNLDWVIDVMKQLWEEWNSYGTTVSADAVAGLTPEVTVEGDLKEGLTFHFTLVKGDQGVQGETGNGIDYCTFNNYQLTIHFTDGTDYTTPSLKGDTGSGLQILDVYPTLADLQTDHPTGSAGDGYLVGTSPNFTLYVWSTSQNTWLDGGALTNPSPSITTPLMDGNADTGSELAYARGDHVHPSDTTKQDVLTAGYGITIDAQNEISVSASIPSPSNNAPLMDGTSDAGMSSTYSRSDHVHPSDTSKQNVLTAGSGIDITGNVISSNAFTGIDTDNVLSTFQNESSYTATEDAWVVYWIASYDGTMSHGYYYQWIDGVKVFSDQNTQVGARFIAPLKKGQTFSVTNYNSTHTNKCNTIVYGKL